MSEIYLHYQLLPVLPLAYISTFDHYEFFAALNYTSTGLIKLFNILVPITYYFFGKYLNCTLR